MKMKQKRMLEKNPTFKHTCHCSDGVEYLTELPESSSCVNPKYFERTKDNKWKDVSDRVKIVSVY